MNHTIETLHNALVHHIVSKDSQEQKRAAKKGRYYNTNALALMIGAAQTARDESEGTREGWVRAVMRNFTVTRTMHTFLKKINPHIDVDHGRWVYKEIS